MENKIFLVGFMGCGKTTVGKLLAQKSDFRFIDTDDLIEKLEGKSIIEIFKMDGELSFRDMESKTLLTLAHEVDNMIISTGGGLPCYNDNMEFMNRKGITVYLKCEVEILYHRIKNDLDKRPLIEKGNELDSINFIRKKLEARRTIYESAIFTLDAGQSADKVVNEIIKKIKLPEA